MAGRMNSAISRKSLILTCYVCSASFLALPAQPAAAQAAQPVTAISVPAGDLGASLKSIAQQAGVRVTFDPAAIAGRRSKRVRRARDARSAILQAIRDTNLALRVTDAGGYDVFLAIAAQPGDIVVTATRDEAETNYRVNRTTTSDRSGGTLRSLPQNTAVVSDKLMRDQQAQTVSDALQNVSGASEFPNTGAGLTSFTLRGFGVAPLRNGTGATANAGNSSSGVEPLANVERIEVIKGPAAILAGQGSLGGTINVVTKKPTADPLLILTGEYQSRGSFKGVIDASTALTSNRLLSARIIADVQGADRSYGGYSGRQEKMLAPSLRFKNSVSDFIIGLSTSEQHQSVSHSTLFNTQAGAAVPIGALFDRPRAPLGRPSAGVDVGNTRFYGDFTQKVFSWLDLIARGEHYKQTVEIKPVSSLSQISPTQLLVFNNRALDDSKGNTADTYARAKFSIEGLKNTIVAGYNHTDITITHFDDTSSGAPTTVSFLDPTFTLPEPAPLATLSSYQLRINEEAAYAQELLEFGPIHLSAAVRRTWYYADTFSRFRNRTTIQRTVSTVPSFGVVVDVLPSLSIYANYIKGYLPTSALDFNGNKLPDIRSSNKEVGFKLDLFGERASFGASVFETEQDNRLISDPAHRGYSISIAGGQRARGVDATLTGQILPALNLNATYTYAEYDFANAAAASAAGLKRQAGQPRHNYSLFVSYDPPTAFYGGAIGIYGKSSSYATFSDPVYVVPGGARVDANIYFKLGKARLNLGVKNLFDKRLYQTTTSATFVPIVDGRTLTATLSYRFF